jgi:anaerobic magnesium-protoporphyrin IX monomethyl ester cyclase
MSLKKPSISSGNEKKELSSRQTDLVLVMVPPFLTETVPLGPAYLSTYLRTHGFDVTVLDLNERLFNSASEHDQRLWDLSTMNAYSPEQMGKAMQRVFSHVIEAFIQEVVAKKAYCIGFSVTCASVCFAVYLAHQIKASDPEGLHIFGGSGTYVCPTKVDPEHRIDMFVVGEGEKPLLEIMRRYKADQSRDSLRDIPGTVLRLGAEYLETLPQDYIKDLDDIPFPKFDEFDFNRYNVGTSHKPVPILFSRGCINRCRFCSDRRLNFPYRFRSAEKIFEELLYHNQHYGVSFFKVNDLLCNGNLQELEKLCDFIIARGLCVQWESYAAIREGMTPTLLRKMKKAGCIYLCYGLESASDSVLRAMNKRYTARLAQEVLENTYKANIITAINVIVGFPGERERDFKKTRMFIEKNYIYISEITNVSTYMFMQGTDIDDDPYFYGLRSPLTVANIKLFVSGKKPEIRLASYCAIYGNTPKVRIRRLRQMMRVISRLGITNRIVNYVQENDPDFESFLTRLREKETKEVSKQIRVGLILENRRWLLSLKAAHKKIDVVYSKEKSIVSFRPRQRLLTRQMGFNTSLCLQGHWTDSTFAIWEAYKERDMVYTHIEWPAYGVTQEWHFYLKEKSLCWRVKTLQTQRLEIALFKAGIFISETYSQFIPGEGAQIVLMPFTDEWQAIKLANLTPLCFSDRNGPRAMSDIVFDFHANRPASLQVQVPPRKLCSRMVSICYASGDENQKKQRMTAKEPLIFDLEIRLH